MGTNGLSTRDVLEAKGKCPDSPTKRKFRHLDDAWDAARESSAKSRLDIAPYACPGCGYYHLTKKVDGSDIAVMAPVGITTGALRKKVEMPTKDHPERVTVEEPAKPGNKEFRLKVLAEYLKDRDSVSTSEVCDIIDVKSYSAARKYMHDLGWKIGKGRMAKWEKASIAPLSLFPEVRQVVDEVEATVKRHPAGKGTPQPAKGAEWRPVDLHPMPATTTLKDLFDIYRAAGLEMRIEVRDHPDGSGA